MMGIASILKTFKIDHVSQKKLRKLKRVKPLDSNQKGVCLTFIQYYYNQAIFTTSLHSLKILENIPCTPDPNFLTY